MTESRETLISPFMVYMYHPSGLEHVPAHDAASLEEASTSATMAVNTKLQLKAAAGMPVAKSLDLSKDMVWHDLTEDRQAALHLARDIMGVVSAPRLYGLAQTAVMHSNVHYGYKGNLWGESVDIRVEEGLTVDADEIVQRLVRDHGREVIDAGRERRMQLAGIDRPIQVTGYEFNPTGGTENERQFIRDIPSCEMYMSAIAADQLQYAPSVVRILPWFMEDREVDAMRVTALLREPHDDERITSIILGPSGDIKRVRTWYDQAADKHLLTFLKQHRVDVKASALAEQLSTNRSQYYAEQWRQVPQALRQDWASPNMLQGTIKERVCTLLDGPYRAYPIAERHRPKAGQTAALIDETLRSLQQNEVQLLPQSDRTAVIHYAGRNTNNVVQLANIPLASRKNKAGETLAITLGLIFTRVSQSQVNQLERLKQLAYTDPQLMYQALLDHLTANEPRYTLIEAQRTA